MSSKPEKPREQGPHKHEHDSVPFQFPTSDVHPAPSGEPGQSLQSDHSDQSAHSSQTGQSNQSSQSSQSGESGQPGQSNHASQSGTEQSAAVMPAPFRFPTSTPGPLGGSSDLDTRDPAELTEEELRLMADTMPGEEPGGD